MCVCVCGVLLVRSVLIWWLVKAPLAIDADTKYGSSIRLISKLIDSQWIVVVGAVSKKYIFPNFFPCSALCGASSLSRQQRAMLSFVVLPCLCARLRKRETESWSTVFCTFVRFAGLKMLFKCWWKHLTASLSYSSFRFLVLSIYFLNV